MASKLLRNHIVMKRIKPIVLWGVVASLAAAAIAAVPVTRHGTSVLHYMTRNALVSTPIASNATGGLRLQYNTQGNSLKQMFQLNVAGLGSNTSYSLFALSGDALLSVPVATFTTDRQGKARVSYMARGSLNGHGHSKNSLPAGLDPLTDLHVLSIVDADTKVVASATIDLADSFQYLVKRNLTVDNASGAAGSISLIGSAGHVSFRLLADSLTVSNTYYLALNSNVVATATSDDSGVVQIGDWPTNAPALLDVQLLQLLDNASNAVLSTTLPKAP